MICSKPMLPWKQLETQIKCDCIHTGEPLRQPRLERLWSQREELLKGVSTSYSHIFNCCTRLQVWTGYRQRLLLRSREARSFWPSPRTGQTKTWDLRTQDPIEKGGTENKSWHTADISLKTLAKLWSYMKLQIRS